LDRYPSFPTAAAAPVAAAAVAVAVGGVEAGAAQVGRFQSVGLFSKEAGAHAAAGGRRKREGGRMGIKIRVWKKAAAAEVGRYSFMFVLLPFAFSSLHPSHPSHL